MYKHNGTNTIPASQYAHKTLYTPSIFVVGLTVYKEYNENWYVPMSQSTLGHMIYNMLPYCMLIITNVTTVAVLSLLMKTKSIKNSFC